MSQTLTVHQKKQPIYDIMLEHTFDRLREKVEALALDGRRICIVTDETVAPLYLDAVRRVLADCASMVTQFVMPAGEEHKNLDVVRQLYLHLIENGFDRKDLLAALGGGVVGDLTGFAAATYLRGIAFVQIPTTLLAQVDSSIGGKTGVDFGSYKNMVGAFFMPRLVYMNLSTLQSLPERIYLSGMGEIIKHALIRDAAYFDWLVSHQEKIVARDPATLEQMIAVSCRIKRAVVEEDPKEQGLRAILNMGHTLGHAIEKQAGFSLYHGECVAIGCVAASFLSLQRGLIDRAAYDRIREAFCSVHLPVTVSGLTAQAVLEDVKKDKKMDAGSIRFILIDRIGNAYPDRTVTMEEMAAALAEVGVGA